MERGQESYGRLWDKHENLVLTQEEGRHQAGFPKETSLEVEGMESGGIP